MLLLIITSGNDHFDIWSGGTAHAVVTGFPLRVTTINWTCMVSIDIEYEESMRDGILYTL